MLLRDGETELQRITTKMRQALYEIESITDRNKVCVDYVPSDEELVRVARRMIAERRAREKFFNASDLGEAFWDILLDLFVAKLLKQKVSVSDACVAASVPPTTALRQLWVMTGEGKIVRTADPNDARRVYVTLSNETTKIMRQYLTKVITTFERSCRSYF